MKVIKLTNRTIFVDDIISIYEEHKCSDYSKYSDYYVETKYKNIPVDEYDYKIVQDYLLSLNEPIYEELPKKDKKIEKLNEHFYQDEPALIAIMAHKINEIIDYLKSKGE